MDAIKKLFEEKNYLKVIYLVEEELSKSFDLTVESISNEYFELNQIKEISFFEILNHANFDYDFNVENFRSFASGSSRTVKKKEEKDIKPEDFLAPFQQIKIAKSDGYNSKSEKSVVYVISTDTIPKYLEGEDLPDFKKLSKQFSSGNFFDRLDDKGNRHYYIPMLKIEEEDGLEKTLVAFLKVIKNIYDEESKNVTIRLTLNSRNNSDAILKTYFYLLLVELLACIPRYNSPNNKPQFLFVFDNDKSKIIFEKIVIRLNKPEEKILSPLKSLDERLESIAREAWTKDEKYIETLKSVLSIIDEEDVSILIMGESGVGKSRLAKIIHDESIRALKPFEELNCGGLSKEMIDQKLNGWVKGAFTGALRNHDGKIKRAEKGTLFLDEIDRTTPGVRNSILTFIDTKIYEVLGDIQYDADVRLIYGTNKDLKRLIKTGQFEEDFYNRISDRIIKIPSLKERPEDIDLIIHNSLNEFNDKKDRFISIDKDSINYLKNQSWPGNVRQLHNHLRQVYYDSLFHNENEITLERLKNTPIDNISPIREDDFELFVELMKKFLDDWGPRDTNFLKGFVFPILAKVYLDDYSPNTKSKPKHDNAMTRIGISGENYNSSLLNKSYDLFNELRKQYLS